MNTAAAQPAASYAGDVRPAEAWRMLTETPEAVLIDVRTLPEWLYVGVADLSALGRQSLFIAWQVFPAMQVDPQFVERVEASGVGRDQPILLLCRSGVRSKDAAIALTAAGFGPCYNVAEGFEGVIDPAKHRAVNGWKMAGLPWIQS